MQPKGGRGDEAARGPFGRLLWSWESGKGGVGVLMLLGQAAVLGTVQGEQESVDTASFGAGS